MLEDGSFERTEPHCWFQAEIVAKVDAYVAIDGQRLGLSTLLEQRKHEQVRESFFVRIDGQFTPENRNDDVRSVLSNGGDCMTTDRPESALSQGLDDGEGP